LRRRGRGAFEKMKPQELPHFWQGERIGDKELEARLENLHAWISESLDSDNSSLDIGALLSACERYAKALRNKQANYAELLKLVEDPQILVEMAAFLDRSNLEQKLQRELGSRRPFLPTREEYFDSIFEAWAPLGFLVHIAPSNSPTVAPLSLIEGLLSGNLNFLKLSSADNDFSQTFISGLLDCDPTGTLKNFVVIARFSSRNQSWLERLFQAADGISAWGGEEAVQSIKKVAPSATRVIEWGHKISFVYLTADRMTPSRESDTILEEAAKEVCFFEQQACSSPQCIYVDTDDWSRLEQFGERFAKILDRVSATIPKLEPMSDESGEITLVTELEKQEGCFGKARVIESLKKDWRVLIDARSPLAASPLFRTIWIKPLPRKKIVETLRPMRSYLQTVGVSCSMKDLAELSDSLIKAGAVRIRRIGEMPGSYSGEAHDGVYALQRYCKRVSIQAMPEAKGISSFSDLRLLDPPIWDKAGQKNLSKSLAKPKILKKSDFQDTAVDTEYAHLYFKSGGSSGEPKLSVFTYDDYHEQMRIGAEGLYAAGLDPIRDRNMNLFFSGALYGGFLSIFSVLEELEAVQFPMAAQFDFPMVSDAIIKNKVNVLLGMPSYIIQLFEKCADSLAHYKGVEKIFYGGEHFNDVQRRYLQDKFGVKIIKSVGYGSVDTGPLAYQCTHCEGGEHHVHQRLQYMEIVGIDDDQPVSPVSGPVNETVGKLIFTSRMRKGQSLDRYEIGDVGHWVKESCPCGRASPKFKLLGRSGDVFRIGSIFLNYRKFVQLLSEVLGYAGPVQLVLSQDQLREKVTVRVSSVEAKLTTEEIQKTLLSGYDDLNEVVVVEKILNFEVLLVNSDSMDRTKGSAKLISVVDQRAISRGTSK
jgi:phenylacetate-coenzyme A ligase PaaK-like adenylate-forming protein